jgi:hypothetical protein
MWTAKNRGRYDRSKLRYPSDLSDDEWALVEPLIPPARRGGNKRHVDVREVMNGIMYILSTGCQWRAIRKICRHVARCMIISTCGATTARSIASITRFICSAANTAGAKPVRLPQSSIARASRALKKGALYRSAWL